MLEIDWKISKEWFPGRCINIDWLEVFCTESTKGFPHDANYFRNLGISVNERDYGTRQYKEMFVLLDQYDEPFVEIRRAPVSEGKGRVRGIFNPYNCHIKLANKYCYHPDAIGLFEGFLQQYGYTVERLYRFDLCMDFEKFDGGDDPNDFIKRYLKGRYAKINQCNLAAHGVDRWSTREWNSLSWGSPTSMVNTKLYNKTLELKQAKDKPYIKGAWLASDLIDNSVTMTRKDKYGKEYEPQIYRLEYSIKSSARGWFVYEDNNGNHEQQLVKSHALETYRTKQDQLDAFAFLTYHYFHFKIFEDGVRKDRCKDKILFDFNVGQVYKLDRVLTSRSQVNHLHQLVLHLKQYRDKQFDKEVRDACTLLITQLESDQVRDQLPDPYESTELDIIREALAIKINRHSELSIQEIVARLRPLFESAKDFW